jgi:hypothetical protein
VKRLLSLESASILPSINGGNAENLQLRSRAKNALNHKFRIDSREKPGKEAHMEGFEEAHKAAQKNLWFFILTIIILLNITGVIFSVVYWLF